MRKKQLVYITIIISLITTNIAYGYEIIKGNQNITKLVEEIDSLLKITYTHPDETGSATSNTNSVYEIIADEEIIENTFDLKLKIEKYIVNQNVLDLQIIDKGHKIENQNILGKELSKYDRYETYQDLYNIYTENKDINIISNISLLDKNNNKAEDTLKIEKVVITLINNNEIEITKGSDKLDFTKYIDKNGNRVDLTNVDITTTEGMSVIKTIVGFDKAKGLGYLKEFDIPSRTVANLKIIEDGLVEEKSLDEYYNGSYSKTGENLISVLADKVFYHNGSKFNINYDLLSEGTDEEKSKNNISKIIYKNDRYSFDIKMNVVKDVSLYLSKNQNFKLTIYSNNQAKLNQFRNDVINAVVNEDKSMMNTEYYTLAGNDRFETSVEVSKEYTKANNANGVVLVGENAVVDGLSAAPFARYKNSPILLTKKDEVPRVVMDEIKRIFNNFKGADTVYLIGGESVISDNIYNQLVDELKNVRVMRINGEDRYETSINICSKMDLKNIDKAYIVGGDGEVDAMSIAPLAVREGVPIIVSPKNCISKDIKRFIEYYDNITHIEVIGGQDVVSTDVLMDIKDAAKSRRVNKDISLKRVWGNDRHETNAKVLEKFNIDSEDRIVVAKDGIKSFSHLIDSMSASILGYPMVLSTDRLIDEQVFAVDMIVSDGFKLIQVGNGIDYSVIHRIIN